MMIYWKDLWHSFDLGNGIPVACFYQINNILHIDWDKLGQGICPHCSFQGRDDGAVITFANTMAKIGELFTGVNKLIIHIRQKPQNYTIITLNDNKNSLYYWAISLWIRCANLIALEGVLEWSFEPMPAPPS